jgi:quinoprotein glucose dehydrogenase
VIARKLGAATVDVQRGLVFLPVGQPAPQYYGGERHGDILYSSSIVALEAVTGKVRWHFQITHHDVWDYDAEAAPSLIELARGGKRVPVVVAVSKPGLMFFLERETGKPIYPVEERSVPQSDVPGEQTSLSRFPRSLLHWCEPASNLMRFSQGSRTTRNSAATLCQRLGGSTTKALTLPTAARNSESSSRVSRAPNYGGVAVDPKSGLVFVNSRNVGRMGGLDESKPGDQVRYRRFSPLGPGTINARFWNPATQLPCQKPTMG